MKPDNAIGLWIGLLLGSLLAGLSINHSVSAQASYCGLTEQGDWAVRRDGKGRSHLFLAPRPFDVPDEELRCEIHPRSTIMVHSVPRGAGSREGV